MDLCSDTVPIDQLKLSYRQLLTLLFQMAMLGVRLLRDQKLELRISNYIIALK